MTSQQWLELLKESYEEYKVLNNERAKELATQVFKITCSSEVWDEVIGYIALEVKGNSAICRGEEYALFNGTMFIRTYKNNIFFYNMVKKYGG